MNKYNSLTTKFILVLFLLILCGCNNLNPPTNDQFISAESTATSITTPVPSIQSAIVQPLKVEMGFVRNFAPLGYFTYLNLDQFIGDFGWDMVNFGDEDQSVTISFFGSLTPEYSNYSSEKIVKQYLDALNKKGQGTMTTGSSPEALIIDEIDCLLYQVSGTLYGRNTYGKAFLARLEGDRNVFGLGLSLQEPAEEVWAKRGEESFLAFINSLQFIRNETVQRGCQVSTDPTYGYTMDNPIQVGGTKSFSSVEDIDLAGFSGVRREEIYLMLLSGPNGERISNTRNGSFSYGESFLDEYSITIEGDPEPKTIYIDFYHFSPPFAPLGFSCYDYFPFEEPR